MALEDTQYLNLEAMRSQIRHRRDTWTIQEDKALLNIVNKHCHRSGRMSWGRSRLLPGRTFDAMKSRWKVLHSSCFFDNQKWHWKEQPEQTEPQETTRKTKRDEVHDFLKMYPDADNSTVANFVNCDQSYVSRIRTENKINGTDIPEKKESPRKTPENAPTGIENKRVVVKKSFLWGAFKFERYE